MLAFASHHPYLERVILAGGKERRGRWRRTCRDKKPVLTRPVAIKRRRRASLKGNKPPLACHYVTRTHARTFQAWTF